MSAQPLPITELEASLQSANGLYPESHEYNAQAHYNTIRPSMPSLPKFHDYNSVYISHIF
jgi:hypothetical protein